MHKMGVHMAYFFQSMLRRDLVCMKSFQSLHCSRTYTKWVCLWHLLSVNAQTSLSMRTVSPEPSLLSHMRKMGVHTAYSFSQCLDEPKRVCSPARAFTALAHTHNGRTNGMFVQSMLRRAIAYCSLSRVSTALAHAQNGRTYGIFFQSVRRRDLVCMQSCQSLHCSRTYTKWVCL